MKSHKKKLKMEKVNVSPSDFKELADFIGQRFSASDKRFDAVDKRFDAVDKRFDASDKRFDRVDKELSEVRDRVSELGGQFNMLQEAVDTYAKKADSYFQEMLMLSHKVDRLERWLLQIADKVNVKLKP